VPTRNHHQAQGSDGTREKKKKTWDATEERRVVDKDKKK
jgi:hypothetical protein